MDVVVRTPHGDADIDIVAAPADTTLSDVLRAVTGQAPPPTARVDDRTVATSQRLGDLDLVIGSLIDTRPATLHTSVDAAGVADLVQLTGRGAGIVRTLGPGRFRVGSSRRLHAGELESAAVETPAFELDISDSGHVRATPGSDIGGAFGVYTPTLDDQLFDRELEWTTGRLHVGGRLFELDRSPTEPEPRRLPPPAADGTVAFQRVAAPPGDPRRLVVDSMRDAASGAGQLWQRRADDPGAYDAPFGIHPDGTRIASVDLLRHRGVALVGSDRFTAGIARTLLVELSTLHGPADLEIVVASAPERGAQWNWVKWLPHVRVGGPTTAPHLFTGSEALAAWANSLRDPSLPTSRFDEAASVNDDAAGWQPPSPGATDEPLTLLVLDDIALWSQRDSPIRSLLIDPPSSLRIMALCVGLHEAPGLCTTLLEEVPPADRLANLTAVNTDARLGRPALFGSLVTQHTRRSTSHEVETDIRPALVEISQATETARLLAPLDDLDARRRVTPPTRVAPPTLAELVEESARRTASDGALAVTLGLHTSTDGVPVGRRPVTVDLTDSRPTIVAVADPEQHDQTVASIVLGAASQRSPDSLTILVVGRERPSWHDELPHIAGWAGRDEADDAPRLVHRVAHVLAERPELHVVVVLEHAYDHDDPLPAALITGMTELAMALPNVHVVLTADHPTSIPDAGRAACGVLAWLAPSGDGTVRRGAQTIPFVGVSTTTLDGEPHGPTELDAPQLIVRPTTDGRAMTPLERRLSRASTDNMRAESDDLATAAVARQVTSRVVDDDADATARPSLLPPPLPIEIDAASLLAHHSGDGIPIGLVDRPELAENEAYWWQPGSGGSMLAAGSPRSAMTALVDLIVTGLAARISADDVHVYAVEALPQRRRALDALPHTGSVVTPDDSDDVVQLIAGLHAIMTERRANRAHDGRPDLVLLISDVGRMRRSMTAEKVHAAFEQLAELATSGAGVGINVIAVTTRFADLGSLARLIGDRLVGPTTDPEDRSRLGAPAIGPADRHPRRCWSVAADRRVQLATPPVLVDEEVERLAPERAREQPPVAIVGVGRS